MTTRERKAYYSIIPAKATNTADTEAAKAERRKAKEAAEAEAAKAEALRNTGLAPENERAAELAATIHAKAEAAKAAEKARAIDTAPESVKRKVEAFRAENTEAAKTAELALAAFAESRAKEAAYGKGVKINWFDARRVSAERVVAYHVDMIWSGSISAAFGAEEERLTALLDAAKAEKNAEAEAAATVQIAALAAKKAEVLRDEKSFRFTKTERAAAEKCVSATSEAGRVSALVDFLREFTGLNLTGNAFPADVVRKYGSEREGGARELARSNGSSAVRNIAANGFIKYVFQRLFAEMYSAGTIKPVHVPEEVRAWYAPKDKKNKKSK